MGRKFDNLAGRRFGRLVALHRATLPGEGPIKWACQCDCGKAHTVARSNLVIGDIISCGCFLAEFPGNFQDLKGQRFGRLVVLERVSPKGKKHIQWRCICDCGKESLTKTTYLMSGDTTSCGCRGREALLTGAGNKESVRRARARGVPTCTCEGPRKRATDGLCNKHRSLWHHFHVTPEMYDTMFLSQDGRCVICDSAFSTECQPNVDHDHTSLHVRALLCHLCNKGLGQFRDRVDLLAKAIEYLQKDYTMNPKARITFGRNGTTTVRPERSTFTGDFKKDRNTKGNERGKATRKANKERIKGSV